VLSPTRTYAPIIKKILDKYDAIHGMVHCSGGAQTNSSFRRKLTHHKDNLFPVPLFTLIQEQSKTERNVSGFNCGHRMEIYVPEAVAQDITFQNRSMSMLKSWEG
jgi:phosphoribosylformylglycinamidine cyclo-ligase